VTYANKSAGMFEQLINNEHGVQVKVLGWGTKWNGYMDKLKGVLKYIENKSDEDIIIYIDGFDSKIVKNIDQVKSKFENMNCKVLFSIDPLPKFQHILYLNKIIFNTCRHNRILNAGMFMGYVKYLKIIINDTLHMKCMNDQVNINKLCDTHNFIAIDEKELIFKNISTFERKSHITTGAVFISFPGSTSNIRKVLRTISEYLQFLYNYILIVHLILLVRSTKKTIIMTSLILISTYYYFYCDRSCV
tara:strand:+ start:1 stop:741 length:741 start_codon:yes stop_codon:yes gene_type:complete